MADPARTIDENKPKHLGPHDEKKGAGMEKEAAKKMGKALYFFRTDEEEVLNQKTDEVEKKKGKAISFFLWRSKNKDSRRRTQNIRKLAT